MSQPQDPSQKTGSSEGQKPPEPPSKPTSSKPDPLEATPSPQNLEPLNFGESSEGEGIVTFVQKPD